MYRHHLLLWRLWRDRSRSSTPVRRPTLHHGTRDGDVVYRGMVADGMRE